MINNVKYHAYLSYIVENCPEVIRKNKNRIKYTLANIFLITLDPNTQSYVSRTNTDITVLCILFCDESQIVMFSICLVTHIWDSSRTTDTTVVTRELHSHLVKSKINYIHVTVRLICNHLVTCMWLQSHMRHKMISKQRDLWVVTEWDLL